ncbi:hypothetical protein Poli38472_011474 [Pythium oligandrum]|uniref:PH domain-containing protein n=1 Tax=Pythium oligandrum TaxID=41045 RepID=A0A8K1CK85_PYTOL|nr:hypothetical protein Poli38472_011474 [Pythium oligandrum]|eukprot:TMW64594.1 hypothetical protein Poli38472_011474 [Pythium oligandrum]
MRSAKRSDAPSLTSLASMTSLINGDERLRGTVAKKNVGFLRQWRQRNMVISADGFLRYNKKTRDGVRLKELDLVKADISHTVMLQNGHYCIEIQSGQKHFHLGFDDRYEALEWQEMLFEAADENAAGRRAWVANLRHALTLNLRDRREIILTQMSDRDWMTEWSFCWRALTSGRSEDGTSKRRRLKRLYTIWLQFHLFSEIVAEIFFASVQTRQATPPPFSGDSSVVYSESDRNSNQSYTDTASSIGSPRGTPLPINESPQDDDVDELRLKTVRIQFGSKTWRGHKRLSKEVSELAVFLQTLDQLLTGKEAEGIFAKFPIVPLQTAFTMREVRIVASAQLGRSDIEIIPYDKRDLSDLIGYIRSVDAIGLFPFRDMPELWVHRIKGSPDGTLVRAASRYDNVLQESLRSHLVYGVLLRSNGGFEVLSSLDVNELAVGKMSRWAPVLDLVCHMLNPVLEEPINKAARDFFLKRPKSVSFRGDVVISIDPEKCRLPLDLKEAFVLKNQIDLIPLIRQIDEVKQSNSRLRGIGDINTGGVQFERGLNMLMELEGRLKTLLRRHIVDVAERLVTLGDATIGSLTATEDGLDFRNRSQSSVAAMVGRYERGPSNALYVFDTLHLRRVLRKSGVQMRFLPLVYAYLDPKRQPGTCLLVASEIIARIAKNLFQFRLYNDQSAPKSRWQSRKARLVQFINTIMTGITSENSQFWQVDAPIWLLLGPMSSSFPLAEPGTFRFDRPIDLYRQAIKFNPSVLFTCLLNTFQVFLAGSYFPVVDELRYFSLPFLRGEDQLSFVNEEVDPKLALGIHKGWLKAGSQFFRRHFASVKKAEMSDDLMSPQDHEEENDREFFDELIRQFRRRLNIQHATRLEETVRITEINQILRMQLLGARDAVREEQLDAAKELIVKVYESLTVHQHVAVPVEVKIALMVIEGLVDSSLLPASHQRQLNLIRQWYELIDWLRFFYRPSSRAQTVSAMSTHPLAHAILLMIDECKQALYDSPDYSQREVSVSAQVQDVQATRVWEEVIPAIDRQCYQAVTGNPTVSAFTARLDRSNSLPVMPNGMHPLSGSGILRRTSSFQGGGPPMSAQPMRARPPVSARENLLQVLDCFVLTEFAYGSSWWVPALWLDAQHREVPFPQMPPASEDLDFPGLPLLWGRPSGLSLDDESKLASTDVAGTKCRPLRASEIKPLLLPLPARRVIYVSCGYRHTALISSDRQLYTFGYGECGRLGHGDEEPVDVPKRVEFFADLRNTTARSSVAQVSCGREHTLTVLQNGDVYGFGWAEAGRLGTGESGSVFLPTKVEALRDIQAVACGREHSLALNTSGQVFAFGAGFGGRIGNGKEEDEELPVHIEALSSEIVVAIDAGECHSCAVTQDGKMFTWGFGSSGALGTGSRENELVPKKIEGPWKDNDGEWVTSAACGSYHTLARTNQGRLYGWGDAAAGQLGEELLKSEDMVVLTPHEIELAVANVGEVELISQEVRDIACGTFMSAACSTDGQLFVWGSAAAGNGAQLDPEDAKIKRVDVFWDSMISQISCGAYHSVALTSTPQFC